ncbi:uncharacterized protein LOC119741837 isoform X2 [Patiria miniata]|uniref:WAP domain-containing protein n=1 Tax=Patiria miniata TaxID=46514 RepID=A0A914BCD1_PATMI|nr:uncharacterized protein LOC119741837 isoform X2 [Patiria miniata]
MNKMGKIELMLVVVVAVVCSVHAQDALRKEGICPEFALNSTHNFNVSFDCLSDSECSYDHKCCQRPDGAYRCTEPLPNVTSTMRTTTANIVKPGQCPRPIHLFGRRCPGGQTCSHDGDCYGNRKCCRRSSDDECPSVCRYPDSNTTMSTMRPVSPSFKPSSKPHRDQPGTCPSNYEKYFEDYDWYDITCKNHCNSTDDCAEGELCCVDEYKWEDDDYRERPQADGYRCPVCMKANFDCDDGDGIHKHGQIYTAYYDYCNLCQCYYGQTNCYNVCGHDNDDDYWYDDLYMTRAWFTACVAAGTALLISVIFTLSVCCCLKCCCKDKQQTIMIHQQPPMAQQPGNAYYMSPPKEEKLSLTENGYTTA